MSSNLSLRMVIAASALASALISVFSVEQTVAASAPLFSTPSVTGKATRASEYGKMPLAFELNRGQTDERANFLSRSPGYTLYLTQKAAVLSLPLPEQGGLSHGN